MNEIHEVITSDQDRPVFAPTMATAPVADVTLGRLNANDSDKSNYFEGTC
ncbi:hypothetical protein [Streptomyces paludis]|nr:hypothetical protein [Streptomyces paludis]